MILHLFYKEWLKTRLFAIAAIFVGLGLVTYIYLEIESGIRLRGAFDYLLAFMYGVPQANPYRGLIMYVPLVVALSIGLSQYIPEAFEKRIKLTLHLPIKNTTALYGMLGYGFIILTLIYGIIFGSMLYAFSRVLPYEIMLQILVSVSPWILGGYATYFMIATISMEPSIFRQFLYAIVTFFFVWLFYIGFEHGDTLHTILPLAILVVISCIGLLYTSSRFIKGER